MHRIPPDQVLDLVDRRTLFQGRWGYRNIGQRQRLELESRMLEMWTELSMSVNWSAGAVWRACQGEPGEGRIRLIGHKPETALSIDPGRAGLAESAPRRMVLQAATLGIAATRFVKRKPGAANRLLWHGLAAEITEALAVWCSRRAAGEMGWHETRRISPGFPAWPELTEQRKLFRLLQPGGIGIRLKRNMMMEPEYSTTAALFPI